jgi:hypothetical protein
LGDQEEMCPGGMCHEYLSFSGSCPIVDVRSSSAEHFSYIIWELLISQWTGRFIRCTVYPVQRHNCKWMWWFSRAMKQELMPFKSKWKSRVWQCPCTVHTPQKTSTMRKISLVSTKHLLYSMPLEGIYDLNIYTCICYSHQILSTL